MRNHFFKAQTTHSFYPPIIHGEAKYDLVRLTIGGAYSNDAKAPVGLQLRQEVSIMLTANETMALAAWLSEKAERIAAKAAKKTARAEARKAAKQGKQQ